MTLYLLFESAIGYALFQKLEFDEMNAASVQLQKAISNMDTFSKMVRLKVKPNSLKISKFYKLY